MNNEKGNKIRLAIVAFSMNFTVGNLAMLIGSSLTYLADFYQYPTEVVVLMGSSFAAGRVIASSFIGKASDKYGPLKTLKLGVICIIIALTMIPMVKNIVAGFVLAFILGVGFCCNDAIVPSLIAYVFPNNYTSMLSFGQGLYAGGGFLIAFLIGTSVKLTKIYSIPYYLLAAFAVVLFVLISISHYTPVTAAENEDSIKPLYSKNKTLSFVLLALTTVVYCGVCNCVGLYTTSYCINLGIDEVTANYILSIYNIGGAVGSIVFVPILSKVAEKKVMIFNSAVGLAAFALALFINTKPALMILLFIAGFFLGVMFSVLVSLSSRIGYDHMASSSALIGTAGGVGDIITPLITSAILNGFGINTTYQYIPISLIITLTLAIANAALLKKESN